VIHIDAIKLRNYNRKSSVQKLCQFKTKHNCDKVSFANLNMENFKYINSQAELNSYLSQNIDCKRLGVDLEFDKNRFAYGFTLSLVQINFGEDNKK